MATADKYDRQLRLWGAGGQRKLMNSHILLINADAAGTETLKNLVLPGVGKFTILDNKVVTPQDVSVNFFLPEKELGKFRADIARETLCEMNSDVEGHCMISTLSAELGKDATFVDQFSVVILTNPNLSELNLASEVCWNSYVPLVVVQSYGFLGQCRLQLREHDMIETKPDPEQIHLRLNNPFESLLQFCESIDFSNQSPEEFAHTPFMAILHHQGKLWSAKHDGKLPKSRAEKKEFKEIIKLAGTPKEFYEDGTSKAAYLRDNYKEAMQNVNKFFEPLELPQNVVELFSTESLMNLSVGNPKIADFKVLLIALKEYIEGPGDGVNWPLSGVVPDLTATSDHFMELQQIYQKKAEQDRLTFKGIVSRLLVQMNRGSNDISDDVIQAFCRNIMNLHYLTSKSAIHELHLSPKTDFAQSFLQEESYWDDPVQTPLLYHYLLVAAHKFHDSKGRYPGNFFDEDSEMDDSAMLKADTDEVWQIIRQIAMDHNVPIKEGDDDGEEDSASLTYSHAIELTRYGGAELHNISSLIGGVAAQECVKVMTHLFVPLHNCYLYNGIAGCSNTFEL